MQTRLEKFITYAGLVFFALVSILFGLATPTEGAGMGAFGAILLALVYKKLTLPGLKLSLIHI